MAARHVPPSLGEEIASSITHGIGAALSLAALTAMIVVAAWEHDVWKTIACGVFGFSLVLLYLASTLYHALPQGKAKRVFRVLDHCAIFLLIAGTYTPFTLVTLRGPWGWTLFGLTWGLAAAGIVSKCFLTGKLEILSVGIYLLMGWCVVIALRPLLIALPWNGFLWLLSGGIAYTCGVAFYALRLRYAHAIWHLFVMAGSICHFCAVYGYVLER